MKILITGVAGFIGFHLAKSLLPTRHSIIGIDNLNNYYDKDLKIARLENLKNRKIKFHQVDISELENLKLIFKEFKPDIILHLAAQAGVRYSINHPDEYLNSNIIGFYNILELSKFFKVKKIFFASSSSVYGESKKESFSESDNVQKPSNLYAVSKKTNELMAYSYSNLYKLKCVGLRFFTVYGPWGRPDMAYFKFTKNIIDGKSIKVFNNGNLFRDFTYIDDIVTAINKLLYLQNKTLFKDKVPYNIINIGNNKPEKLTNFINAIEEKLQKKSKKIFLPMQPGDVFRTSADTKILQELIDFKPNVSIKEGLSKFIDWYKEFYL